MTKSCYRTLAAIALASAWPVFWIGQTAQAQVPASSYLPPSYPNANDPTAVGRGAPGVNPMPNYYGTSAPSPPTNPSRPAGWPGGPPASAAPNAAPGVYGPAAGPPPAQPGAYGLPNQPGVVGAVPYAGQAPPTVASRPVAPPRKSPADAPFDPADILARVGPEVVQANEVLADVRMLLKAIRKENADALARMPPDAADEQMRMAERKFVHDRLEQQIQMKLLLADVRSKYPAEQLAKNEPRFRKMFNEQGIKDLMAKYHVESVADLETKLLEMGTSLDAQRTLYIEKIFALSWLQEQVKDEPEPTHEALLNYYREHPSEWETPAKARWEHLMVKKMNFDSKAKAYGEMVKWGNEVAQRGVPFADVARAHSQDYSAADAGLHDWTSQGSLRSEPLNQAIFSLPLNTLSSIFEDDDGYHIVRVVERHEAKRATFIEVQAKIKDKLSDRDKNSHRMAYVDKLRQRIPVTTVFDEPAGTTANQPSGVISR